MTKHADPLTWTPEMRKTLAVILCRPYTDQQLADAFLKACGVRATFGQLKTEIKRINPPGTKIINRVRYIELYRPKG